MTPESSEQDVQVEERKSSGLTLNHVIPGVQIGLLLAMLPMVGWIFGLKMGPLELAMMGLKEDVGEVRDDLRRMDSRIDDIANRPPNETVMTHIEAILKRLDRLERP